MVPIVRGEWLDTTLRRRVVDSARLRLDIDTLRGLETSFHMIQELELLDLTVKVFGFLDDWFITPLGIGLLLAALCRIPRKRSLATKLRAVSHRLMKTK
jgi:hypothetical protein